GEWQTLEFLIKFLQPLKLLKDKMSKQLTPNLCLTAAYYIQNGHDPELVEAAKLACDKLNKYYPKSDGLVYIVGVDLWKKEYKPQNGQMCVDDSFKEDIFSIQMKKARFSVHDEVPG
ncbi:unnamed protein product, partial [Allacma fusca]